jgi:hypothetical protein
MPHTLDVVRGRYKWSFKEWLDHSKTMFVEDRFCLWESFGRIYLKDTHTQAKTSLIEKYDGSEEKGFQRALIHFENFISIAKNDELELK